MMLMVMMMVLMLVLTVLMMSMMFIMTMMIMTSIDDVTLTIHIVILVHHICINRIIILKCFFFSSRGDRRTNNKLNPHSGSGFEPRPP